jgi:hypothetical protein
MTVMSYHWVSRYLIVLLRPLVLDEGYTFARDRARFHRALGPSQVGLERDSARTSSMPAFRQLATLAIAFRNGRFGHNSAIGLVGGQPARQPPPLLKTISRNWLNQRVSRDTSQLSLALIRSLINVWISRPKSPLYEMGCEISRNRPFVRDPRRFSGAFDSAPRQAALCQRTKPLADISLLK